MTPEEIRKGNILIAQFIGGKYYGVLETGGNPLKAYYLAKSIKKFEKKGYRTQFPFRSWDGIMPVIEEIGTYSEVDELEISRRKIWIKAFQNGKFENRVLILYMVNENADNLLDAVWQAAVEFITWANKYSK